MDKFSVNKEAPVPTKAASDTKQLSVTARETPAHNTDSNDTGQYITTGGGSAKAKKGGKGHCA